MDTNPHRRYTGRTYLAACFANKQHQRSLPAESARRVLYVVSCVEGRGEEEKSLKREGEEEEKRGLRRKR